MVRHTRKWYADRVRDMERRTKIYRDFFARVYFLFHGKFPEREDN